MVYIDNLLLITKDSYENYFKKLEKVLERLKEAKLKVKASKYSFVQYKVE